MSTYISLRHLPALVISQAYCRKTACYVIGTRSKLKELTGEQHCRLPVDFSREFIVALCRGECPTGGYAIRVQTGCVDTEGILTLKVKLTDPAPGAFVTLAMTYPQSAVAVPREPFHGLPGGVVVRESSSGDILEGFKS